MFKSIMPGMIIAGFAMVSLPGCSSETGGDQLHSNATVQPLQKSPINQASKAYKDPITGEFTAPPPGHGTPSVNANARVGSAAPLVETASPVAGGGVLVDLQGRFMQEVKVTKDADGNLHTDCVPGSKEHKNHEK